MQIEHYIPQHDQQGNYNEELSVDFHNMLAVCPGGKSARVVSYDILTCDQHKGNQTLAVDPRSKYSVDKIQYKKDGTIYSTDSDINHDLNEVLNLNCNASLLPQNRKSTLDRFLKSLMIKYGDRQITKSEWKKLRSKYSASDENGLLYEYVGIIYSYIDQKYL